MVEFEKVLMYMSTSSGTINIAAMVEKKDIVMLSGTFPFDQNVKRFEVVPPGLLPTKITPMDINSSKPASLDIKNAANGIQPN